MEGCPGACSVRMALARGCGQGTASIDVVGKQEGLVENGSQDNWVVTPFGKRI